MADKTKQPSRSGHRPATVGIDPDLARKLRIIATARGMSTSEFVSGELAIVVKRELASAINSITQ